MVFLLKRQDYPRESGTVILEMKDGAYEPISPADVPMGDSAEDIEARRKIISKFYHDWKLRNLSLRKFNLSLKEYINIRFVSITETCAHASRNYFSTLAVLQLDAILTNARIVSTVKSKENGNQKPFEKMIIMNYSLRNIKGCLAASL